MYDKPRVLYNVGITAPLQKGLIEFFLIQLKNALQFTCQLKKNSESISKKFKLAGELQCILVISWLLSIFLLAM